MSDPGIIRKIFTLAFENVLYMKILKRILLSVVLMLLGYGVYYAWQALPIISGYNAKIMCSCALVAGRSPESVKAEELSRAPLSMASVDVNYTDSSATASVWGLAKKKAIYRKGLGCTLISGVDEATVRQQYIRTVAAPKVHQDTVSWPMGDRLPAGIKVKGVDYDKLNRIVTEAFAEPSPDSLRRTRAILVVYQDTIIAEQYAKGFDKDSRLIGWSMSKSITNALVGLLVKSQKLNLIKEAPLTLWRDDDRHKISLNNLMHASSGLQWEENYGGPSGATNMLFKEKDMGRYAALQPLQYEPGKVFYYSSGTSNIISWIIRKRVGDRNYYKFPYEELFYKLGMYSMVLEPDAGGTFVGSSYSFATARDWARFGMLYLHDGQWQGEQLLPKGWVTYTTTPAPAAPIGQYGAQWWLNAGAPDNPTNRYYPDAPTDLYWADGFEGQNVFVLPSSNLVIVKLSLSHGDYLDDNQFLVDILSTLPSNPLE